MDERSEAQVGSIARAEGKVPGQVEETVKGAHASTMDWRTLLCRYMTDAAKSDYSWSLPNRRLIDSGLYLPSIRSEGMETIAVIVDTSGSLPTESLPRTPIRGRSRPRAERRRDGTRSPRRPPGSAASPGAARAPCPRGPSPHSACP